MSSPINEIKEKADIVELIADHIPVKRSGAGYIAKCPFHNDTKPSMHISSQKGIYKCFACGAGGDVFKFWSEYHNKDFSETLKDLALRYGVSLKQAPENLTKQKFQSLYLEIYKVTTDYYHEKLLGADSANFCRDYLQKRGIDLNTIKTFRLGYAPVADDDWRILIKHLVEKLKVSEEEIFKVGLSALHEKSGKYYDRFRNRLMVPITNEKNEVIAFGARILEDNPDAPKYINSPETEIYHKGEELFGLSLAKQSIKEKDFVILVEGYFDQISLYINNIKNVVASQGTALTSRQAKLLLKYSMSKSVYLCLDSDKAGELAKERAFELIMQVAGDFNPEIKVIDLGSAKDPDEYISKFGIAALESEIKSAKSFIDYKIEKAFVALKNQGVEFGPREKAKLVSHISRFFYFINNKIELASYVQKLAVRLDLNVSVLEEQINREFSALRKEFGVTNTGISSLQRSKQLENKVLANKIPAGNDILSRFDIELLAIMLEDIRLLEDFMANEYVLNKEENQVILAALVDVSFENPDDDTNLKFKKLSMHEALVGNEYANNLAEIAMEIEKGKKDLNAVFSGIIRWNELHNLKISKTKLEIQLKNCKLDDEASRLMEEIALITAKEEQKKKLGVFKRV